VENVQPVGSQRFPVEGYPSILLIQGERRAMAVRLHKPRRSISFSVAAAVPLAQLHGPSGQREIGPASRQGFYAWLKRGLEWIGALVLLVALAPVMCVAAVLVKLTSRGPAFYSQTRVGQFGRPFPIYKIRTMHHQCESQSGACWSMPGDTRITPVRRFLRATHLDELPQLVNVLRGHMSLIGPRPERPEFLPVLEQAVAGYCKRLQIRPGVTGLAQVQLPADTDLDSVRRKLSYDLYYIQRQGPLLDMQVLLGTAAKVVGIPFSLSRKLFFLPTREVIEQSLKTQESCHLLTRSC
jgi:lipopolysaccharide/colanic/teichoic acid biosynthesis glycosyltransferase